MSMKDPFFRGEIFMISGYSGDRDPPDFKCCRCGCNYLRQDLVNYEYNIFTSDWYQSPSGNQLCLRCVKYINQPQRRCKFCGKICITGKEIADHLRTIHPNGKE